MKSIYFFHLTQKFEHARGISNCINFIRKPQSNLYCFLPIQKLTVSLQADKHQPHDAKTQPNCHFVILESDGATWRFRHRMIQDYFAALWAKETTFLPKITNNE